MKRLLPFLIAIIIADSAQAQALWRNFFTTNRDPIVEVVAGSNATVQATTVGSNLRRFTVNSTATGGTNSLVQTNISYVAVTNSPWQFGDSDLTNWATLNTNVLSTLGQTNISYTAVTNAPWQFGDSDLTNWATLNTNVLSTLGQTNISYVAVTNAPWQTGSVNLTNWSGTPTNLAAFLANNQVFTGSNYFTQPLTLSVATNTPSAGQVLTATSPSSAEWGSTLPDLNIGNLIVTNPPYLNLANSTNYAASNIISGGQLPAGTVASIPAPADGWILGNSNSLRNWTRNGGSLTNIQASSIVGAITSTEQRFLLSSYGTGMTIGGNNTKAFSLMLTGANLSGGTVAQTSVPIGVASPYTVTNFTYGADRAVAGTNLVWRVYTNGVFAPPILNTMIGTSSIVLTNDSSYSVTLTDTSWTNTICIQASNTTASSISISLYATCQVVK